MASSLPKEIADFMATYHINADEVWEVRNGAYAIKHKALERVAAALKITFDPPHVVEANAADKIAVICVTGRKGDRMEWSIGEASPANNKNAYCYAMAEKRGKDRVVLKLLQTHGAIYSESEADEFGDPDQSEKGTLLRSSQYAREEYKKLIKGMDECTTGARLEEWARAYREQIRACPFVNELRAYYADRLTDLSGNTERSNGNGVVRAAR